MPVSRFRRLVVGTYDFGVLIRQAPVPGDFSTEIRVPNSHDVFLSVQNRSTVSFRPASRRAYFLREITQPEEDAHVVQQTGQEYFFLRYASNLLGDDPGRDTHGMWFRQTSGYVSCVKRLTTSRRSRSRLEP